MYPFIRITTQVLRYKSRPIAPWDTHVSHHRILPWDLDVMAELNNGLTLTIYDMGRIPFAVRTGVWDLFKANGMALTIAGSSVRYRRRLTLFERIEQRTRIAGWDSRFIYFDQSLWTDPETCAGQGVFRAAVVKNRKMVNIDEVVVPLVDRPEIHANRPHLPGWISAWAEADNARPWPPERV
ncbi:thioeseterase [Oceanicola sp. 22II-s10i]|uniref:acyl-CoA thioesterase n=1 Tax=Oceanicola sp. 22II-s10i TaxID=1317116 RepID=UPI000B525EC2|nr:acyl-CoA thioesterase [Oceanicola sp. 22II-s10i]OWU86231.1 thioeseterase [Oceanicola sp. 22II-s10i]